MLVYIHGAPGTGKTLLCHAIARAIRPAIHLEELPGEMELGVLYELLDCLRSTLLVAIDVDHRDAEEEATILDLNEPRRVLVVTGADTKSGSVSKAESSFRHTADVVIQALKWTPDGGSYRVVKNRFGAIDLCNRTDREIAALLAEGFVASMGLRPRDVVLQPKETSSSPKGESARPTLVKGKART
jgi:hypothetical protein